VKILQLNPAFYPALAYGGTVNVSYNLAKALAKRGHDVTVFTSDTIDKRTRQRDLHVEHEGVKIHYFRNVSNLLAWHRYLLYPGLIRALKDHIQDFDIVHLHGTRNFQNIVAAHYANKYGIPYVVQPHGSLPLHLGKQNLKRLYDVVWGDKILQNADGIIALTSLEAEQIVKSGVEEDRVHIIANGLDLSQYKNTPPRGEFRALYNIPSDTYVILFLGRLHPIKGLDLLIRAFEIISRKIDNCVLVVAGPDDGSLSELKALAEELNLCEKVLFTGPLYNKDKFAVYSDSDIYVLPSYYETFPITVLEAWAFKKPVIVTENCGIKDLVEGSGLVVQPNPYDLAVALQKYLQQDSLRHRHGENGYDKLHESLSIQATVGMVENLYRDMIKSDDKRRFVMEPSVSGFAEHDRCLMDKHGNKR
jgi:glycosyltransferase involved in cell wall biosynthesis